MRPDIVPGPISTDNISQTNQYRSGVGALWPFLSDAGLMVQKDLDIARYADPVNNPMIRHEIVLEPGLVINRPIPVTGSADGPLSKIFGSTSVRLPRNAGRIGTSQRANSKKAWLEGRKELFYPYGKSYIQTLGERIRTRTEWYRVGRNLGHRRAELRIGS